MQPSVHPASTAHACEERLRLRQQLVGCAAFHDPPGCQHCDAVAAYDALQLVRNQQDRRAVQRIAVQHLSCCAARHVRRHLVEADDAAATQHCTGQAQQLTVPCDWCIDSKGAKWDVNVTAGMSVEHDDG